MTAKNARTFTVKVPVELSNQIVEASRRQCISRSEFLRRAEIQMLVAERPRISVLDALGDLVGCYEGPSDLSTNPKYMEGFGGE